MNTLGDTPKTTILNHESHKLHQEFEARGLYVTLTFSAALVTGNVIDGNIFGSAIASVTFATNSDATMAAVAAAIAAMDGVESATVTAVAAGTSNDREIVVIGTDKSKMVPCDSFAVTAGASQATVTIATVNKYVYMGQPVELHTDGRVQPITPGANVSMNMIGIAIKSGGAGEMVTVSMIGNNIIYGEATGAINAGAVNYDSYNATTKYSKFNQTSVDVTKMAGWSLDTAASAGDIIRVVTRS